MSILQHFYTVNSKTEVEKGKVEFHVTINEQHPIFQGHFPNMPVTPGVVQLEMVKQLIAQHLNDSIILSEMNSCKYLAILDPTKESTVAIEITLAQLENGWKVNAVIKGSVIYSKISAHYEVLS